MRAHELDAEFILTERREKKLCMDVKLVVYTYAKLGAIFCIIMNKIINKWSEKIDNSVEIK